MSDETVYTENRLKKMLNLLENICSIKQATLIILGQASNPNSRADKIHTSK
jgi:hypothetical protein